MKHRFRLFIFLALIAPSGCGRIVDPNPGKKPTADDPAARNNAGDPAPGVPKQPLANAAANEQAERVTVYRKAAEDLEAATRKMDPNIGKNYTENMMFVALAWLKAEDKDKALAAAKTAIAAGPDDRSPLQKCRWHTTIADVLLQTGEVPLAVEHYGAAYQSAPDPVNAAIAQKKLVEANAKLGNPK